MVTDKEIDRFSSDLDELLLLLHNQLDLARQGGIARVELLSRQADSLVKKIAQAGVLDLPQFEKRRRQLQELYHSLCLTVTAQRNETREKLNHIHKGKKTIGTYRKSI